MLRLGFEPTLSTKKIDNINIKNVLKTFEQNAKNMYTNSSCVGTCDVVHVC